MLLEFVRKPFKNKSKYIRKPLFECPPCMASYWGTCYFIGYTLTWPVVTIYVLPVWILFIFCVAGLNAILAKYFG